MSKKKCISIITPCFHEEDGIEACYAAVKNLFDEKLPNYTREHIFCDNASSDRTVEILREIATKDDEVKVIVNSRNFGILRNTYNGVMSANGDAVLLFLPADLQDPPDLIPEFVNLWEQGYEVVYGIRAQRMEPFLMRTARKLYYRLLSRISNIDYPADAGDFQLIDRKVHDAMKQFHDVQPFMRMMTFECGYKAVGIPYTWEKREHGISRNRFSQLIDQAFNGIVSFSNAPLRFALLLGMVISILSLLYALGVIGLRLVYGEMAPRGTYTIIAALFFFGGVQLFFVGILGEYISAIFNQVRQRPLVFERERINFKTPAEKPDEVDLPDK